MTINTKDYYNLIAPKYITWDFYSKYTQLEPPFGELGLPVFLRTYSRFIKELNRREKWCETILRNIEYSLSLDNISSNDSKKKEAESLFETMFNMQGFPSGRSLWTAGTPQTTKDPSSSWNCTFKVIDNLSAFSEIFYWLLIGAGTGFSVEKKYISKLPKFNPDITIKHEDYFYLKDEHDGSHLLLSNDNISSHYVYLDTNSIINDDDNFINEDLSTYTNAKLSIGDSKEDWCNALRCFLHLLTYPNIQTITFNYDLIRPEGTLIKTFGGRASGHKALLEMFNNILMIIKRCNGVLDSVGVLDIANSIGLNVVSGGVRRTAEIGLGDANDNNFITAKLNLYDDPDKVQYRAIRSMSNNSILFYENPGLDKIKDVMTSIKSNGEPGFWIIGNANKLAESPIAGTNPSLRKGTKVLTDKGIVEIQDLQDQEFLVPNLNGKWSKAKCFLSGHNKPLHKITLTGGHNYYATPEHKWAIVTKNGVIKLETKDLKSGLRFPVLKQDDLYTSSSNGDYDEGVFVGWLLGDGSITTRSDNEKTQINLIIGKDKNEVKDILTKVLIKYNCAGTFRPRLNNTEEINISKKEVIDFLFKFNCLTKNELPKTIWNDTTESFRKGLISALFSSDGNIEVKKRSRRINLVNKSHSFLTDVSELLGFYGIKTSITARKDSVGVFPNGKTYDKVYESYVLRISDLSSIKHFAKLFPLIVNYKQILLNKIVDYVPKKESTLSETIKIEDVCLTELKEDVWDITVYDDTHCFKIAHAITGNCAEAGLDDGQSCNLTTKNVKAHVYFNEKTKKWEYDWELGKKTIELITRIGSRQTTATQWHPKWDELQKRDRLLGVSMTGLMDAFDLLKWDTEQQEYYFKWVKEIAINAANEYHDYLGINRSTRVTLMKPEGTISQLPTVSSGIHRAYSPYYLRRVRFSKTDPLAKVLLNLGLSPVPENNQGDSLFASECTTWVFTFPIKTNTTIRAIDEPAIDQLERYKLAQVNYADRGHNISATITLAPDEYDVAANWINDNWNDIIGVSFLPRFDPISDGKAAYPLMPYEPITEYEYHNLFNVKLTETELIEILAKIENNYEEQSLDSSCSTGACPIR